MNVELLDRIIAYLEEEPKRLDMEQWLLKVPEHDCPCGTVACIAGTALILSGQLKHDEVLTPIDIFVRACSVLQLQRDQAERLFHVRFWPISFCDKYRKTAQGSIEAVQVLKERIEWFKKYL